MPSALPRLVLDRIAAPRSGQLGSRSRSRNSRHGEPDGAAGACVRRTSLRFRAGGDPCPGTSAATITSGGVRSAGRAPWPISTGLPPCDRALVREPQQAHDVGHGGARLAHRSGIASGSAEFPAAGACIGLRPPRSRSSPRAGCSRSAPSDGRLVGTSRTITGYVAETTAICARAATARRRMIS